MVILPAMGQSGLAGSEPAFEVAAVDNAEHEEDAIFADEVVHHEVVADAEPVEGVCVSADGFTLLPRMRPVPAAAAASCSRLVRMRWRTEAGSFLWARSAAGARCTW